MIEYIKQVGHMAANGRPGSVRNTCQIRGGNLPPFQYLVKAFAEELDRLDPRDFDPRSRADFVIKRVSVRFWSNETVLSNADPVCTDINGMLQILEDYRGEGSGSTVRNFGFMTDVAVRGIVERDYSELVLRAFPDGSWKSTVILAGSILEAVLLDRLTRGTNPTITQVMTSAKAPGKRGGLKRDITANEGEDEWKLFNMIEVACDLSLLRLDNATAVHEVLRSYRNFVHPHLEKREGILISEGHATAAKGMLDVCLDQLGA